MRSLVFSMAFAVVVMSFSQAQADLVTPSESDPNFGWTRGDANSFYSGWDVFDAIPDPTPDMAGSNGPGGDLASLNETTGTGIITSTGNIYSFAGTGTAFEVDIPSYDLGAGYSTRIVAQFSIIGSPLDYSSVMLNGVSADFTEVLADDGAGTVDYLAGWDLDSTSSSYQLTFNASAAHMSLDQLHLDGHVAAAVPEPGVVGALGLAVPAFLLIRRRRKALQSKK